MHSAVLYFIYYLVGPQRITVSLNSKVFFVVFFYICQYTVAFQLLQTEWCFFLFLFFWMEISAFTKCVIVSSCLQDQKVPPKQESQD